MGGSDAREPRPVCRRVGSSSKLCIKCRCRAKMLCGTHAQCYFGACENDIHYIISFSSEYLLHQFVVLARDHRFLEKQKKYSATLMMDARFSPWSRCVQKSGTTVAWRAVCPRSSCATHMRHSNKTKKVHQFPVALTSLSIGQSEPKRGAVNHACATSFGAEVAACMLVAKLTTALGWSCRSPPPLLVSLI